MTDQPALLARGPWRPDEVEVRWSEDHYDAPPARDEAADLAIALCVTRSAEGRWLAGRRAGWLSSWPGRWALGAGGAVDVGESPVDTLTRELREEWSVAPERVQVEALVRLPHKLVMLVGQAWLPEGAQVTPDDEHDDYAWWPEAIEEWPPEADEPLRRMAGLLARA
jgi:8-oxo-dGTP diphosphatase